MNILTIASTLLCLTLILLSCDRIGLCKDDELTIQRTDYDRDQLRIDGYFWGDVADTSLNSSYADIYFLYRNGVFLSFGGEALDKAKAGNVYLGIGNDRVRESKSMWGIFKIDGNIIQIERWQVRPNGCETIRYEEGEIRNDTTFVITRREYRSDGKVTLTETPNSTFYFRALLQKPDSTNNFIKE